MNDTITGLWPMFRSPSWGLIQGQGLLAVTELDRDTDDFSHLIGEEVIIDGNIYYCLGVERFSHCLPWTKGERIGLLVSKEGKNAIQRQRNT